MKEHFWGRGGCGGGGEAVKEHLCNVRCGVCKTGERPPLQTRQSKATFVLPWTTHTKKGGPDNGPKKWPALALHTRPGDRKRTPFFQDAPAFFRFCVRARPEVSKLFRSRCRPRPLQQPLPRLRQILTVSSGS